LPPRKPRTTPKNAVVRDKMPRGAKELQVSVYNTRKGGGPGTAFQPNEGIEKKVNSLCPNAGMPPSTSNGKSQGQLGEKIERPQNETRVGFYPPGKGFMEPTGVLYPAYPEKRKKDWK